MTDKINIQQTKTENLYLSEYIYTISDLSTMFSSIPYLKSEDATQQDIVDLLNKILTVLRHDTTNDNIEVENT